MNEVDALNTIRSIHKKYYRATFIDGIDPRCQECEQKYPCVTVQAIEDAAK